MDIKCYYVVKARTAFHNSETGEIEFRARVKKFENENPIEARKAAFDFRNEFICGLLTLALEKTEEEIGWNSYTKQIEKLSDKEIRRLLNPFLEQDNSEQITILNKEDGEEEIIEWITPDDTISWYSKFNSGIWVTLVHNDNDPELISDDDIVIDKITKYEEPVPTPPLWTNLEIEYKLFRKNNFEIANFETTTLFFDDEAFIDGGDDEDDCYVSFKHLKTPFDWTGYDKINWWEKGKSQKVNTEIPKLPITINEAYNEGESYLVEFKPGLVNWTNSDRNIELEIAQTLCAFLNSKGGYLFIGIADKEKKVFGVSFPDNSKDKFLREFTRIKARHLPAYLAHSINGEFYTIDDKTIFVITVFPSFDPVFIRIKDDQNKLITKEFYIRSDASSRHLYDIEEVVRYCKKRDKDNADNE
jgi:hypothetical protein